jgi:5-methylcytosine-specific restriction endonuclease McrA
MAQQIIQCNDGFIRVFRTTKYRNGVLLCCECRVYVNPDEQEMINHECKSDKLNKMFGKTRTHGGTDRWGKYYVITGFEKPGSCFWCGIPVSPSRRYCKKEQSDLYVKYYRWQNARLYCFERYEDRCAVCNYKSSTLEAHHIIPIVGQLRSWNKLNHPDNLIALCFDCHRERHRTDEECKKVIQDKRMEKGTLILRSIESKVKNLKAEHPDQIMFEW